MTTSVLKYFFALVLFFTINIVSSVSHAGMIDGKTAMTVLIGKTWAGKNESGDDYWFWHEPGSRSGTFGAKFKSTRKGTSEHHGTWEIKDAQVCWYWPDWKATHCYTKFEHEGDKLSMTRSDGQVHSGMLIAGNVEGL
ncbi:hypothetical protein L2D14_00840 [Thalassospiraceae bacterium LMO-JJ14]|nr:hypothetical protein L2D14_00840 [Thalassospiraceae bacterium LMO-JJ14]